MRSSAYSHWPSGSPAFAADFAVSKVLSELSGILPGELASAPGLRTKNLILYLILHGTALPATTRGLKTLAKDTLLPASSNAPAGTDSEMRGLRARPSGITVTSRIT